MSKAAWKKVFIMAADEAKEIRKKNPSISYAEAVKRAWKTKKIMDAKAAYKKKYPSSGAKKPARKTTKRKTTKKKTTKRATKKKTTRRKKK